MKKEEEFNFKWKLVENYFNAFIVFSFTLIFVYALIYKDNFYFIVAIVWGIVCPILATFIDKKSHKNRVIKL